MFIQNIIGAHQWLKYRKKGFVMEHIKRFSGIIWVFLGAVGLIFGSFFGLLDVVDTFLLDYPIARKIFIIIFILFFFQLFLVYDLWIQRRNKAAERFGFRINRAEKESNIELDGSAVVTTTVELEVLGPELDAIEHRSIVFGQNEIRNPLINVSGTAEKSNISHRITHQSDKSFIFVIEFSPSLKKNEKARYSIKTEYGPGLYAMDKDCILNMIKNNEWLYNEPYEGDSSKIPYPTDKIVKKVTLPKNYCVGGKEYWDVTVGDGSNIALGEYNRIKKEEGKFFTITYSKTGNMVLMLEVDKPEIGMSYGIKWIPPSKEEYEKCCEHCKDE